MYFFLVSLNVNDAIRKTNAQMIQKSFHKKWWFVTISFKGKGRKYDTFDFKEMKNFDTLNENTNQMHISINRSFTNEDFTTIQLSKEKMILWHFLSTKINKLYSNFYYRLIMTKKTLKKH